MGHARGAFQCVNCSVAWLIVFISIPFPGRLSEGKPVEIGLTTPRTTAVGIVCDFVGL
jgi:hypothetical protein